MGHAALGLEVKTAVSTKQSVLLVETRQLTELEVPGFAI